MQTVEKLLCEVVAFILYIYMIVYGHQNYYGRKTDNRYIKWSRAYIN